MESLDLHPLAKQTLTSDQFGMEHKRYIRSMMIQVEGSTLILEWKHSILCKPFSTLWKYPQNYILIDYFLRKKPAYSITRVLRPIAVGVRRKHND
jgi:hypothetical protein